MSFTGIAEVFGSIHETALNDVLHAFFSARPRYLRYGSPAFVPTTTVNETSISAIPFPGIPGGIDWRVTFQVPGVDLFKQSQALPQGLTLGPGQFSLHTAVELCVNCVKRRDDRGNSPNKDQRDRHLDQVTCAKIGVFGIGHIDSWSNSNGDGAVRLRVDAVELVDITPDALESVLECIIRMILDAVLSQVELPLKALRAGAFQLVVSDGPKIDDDRIKVFGNV
ncbi:MAG TPA: hypothetical protein VFX04_10020 [Rhodanobacteraceae bacterium]|jgi:hypothetical protein|nr:hypothetical protein [Rhodanobacteraceae bacterium]